MSDGLPLWLDRPAMPALPEVAEDLEIDVAIVGGGMVGLHCALGLRDSNLHVAVFEARRIGEQATGRSTAKITSQHGLRYVQLKHNFGEENAKVYARVNEKAVSDICGLCTELGNGVALERKDAYIYARNQKEAKSLREEAEAAAALGLPASLERSAGLPFPVEAVLRFADQAQFDPAAYLRALAKLIGPQIQLFEHSRITEIEEGETVRLIVNGHRIKARHAVIATQTPFVNDGMFFAKAFPFAHPVAAAPLPERTIAEGMFISAGAPGHSFRTAERNGATFLIAAGREYKLGNPDAQAEAVADLRQFLREHFRIARPTHLWTNQDFRAMDGAAFIGPMTRSSPNLLVGTGFDAWGITQGAVAGEILAATILGESHPAAAIYDAVRIKPLAGGRTFVRENVKAGAHLIADKLLSSNARELSEIAPGSGGIVSYNGEQLAVRRDPDGHLRAFSATCTHMGCVVDWNDVDRTWDCPCHGSRFDKNGQVLTGPATVPLTAKKIAPHDKGDT